MSRFFLLLFPLWLFAWDLHKEKDGILIYKEHDEKFEFVQYKANMSLPFSLDTISATIMDYHTYTSWLSDCIHADKSDDKVYILMNPPWPLSHRQVWAVIEKKVYDDKQIITLNSTSNHQSEHSGVWFNYLHAEFLLTPKGDKQTDVSLSLIGDPGGYVASWMVNLMAWKIPYQSLYNLNLYIKQHQALD